MQPSHPPPHPLPVAVAIGRAVKKQRVERDLSQQAAADLADISRKHLGEIEQGKHDVLATTLIKLAGALGVPFAALAAATENELAKLEKRAPG